MHVWKIHLVFDTTVPPTNIISFEVMASPSSSITFSFNEDLSALAVSIIRTWFLPCTKMNLMDELSFWAMVASEFDPLRSARSSICLAKEQLQSAASRTASEAESPRLSEIRALTSLSVLRLVMDVRKVGMERRSGWALARTGVMTRSLMASLLEKPDRWRSGCWNEISICMVYFLWELRAWLAERGGGAGVLKGRVAVMVSVLESRITSERMSASSIMGPSVPPRWRRRLVVSGGVSRREIRLLISSTRSDTAEFGDLGTRRRRGSDSGRTTLIMYRSMTNWVLVSSGFR